MITPCFQGNLYNQNWPVFGLVKLTLLAHQNDLTVRGRNFVEPCTLSWFSMPFGVYNNESWLKVFLVANLTVRMFACWQYQDQDRDMHCTTSSIQCGSWHAVCQCKCGLFSWSWAPCSPCIHCVKKILMTLFKEENGGIWIISNFRNHDLTCYLRLHPLS